MTREMLGHRQDTGLLEPCGKSYRLAADIVTILAKRTPADDRIIGIGIDVCDGSKIDVHTYHPALPPYHPPHFSNQTVIRDAAEYVIVRERRYRLDAHGESPFAVETDHGRDFGEPDYKVVHRDMLFESPFGEVYSAQAHIGNVIMHSLAVGSILLRSHIDHKQLGSTLPAVHLAHCRIRPVQSTLIVDRSDITDLCLHKCRADKHHKHGQRDALRYGTKIHFFSNFKSKRPTYTPFLPFCMTGTARPAALYIYSGCLI